VQINQFPVPLSSLNKGVHVIGVRSSDAGGKWSHTNFQFILIFDKPVSTITTAEYFWDIDPGYFNASDTTFSTPVVDLDNGTIFIQAPMNLSPGEHILFVRTKDSGNRWSHTNYTQVTATSATGLSTEFQNSSLNIYPNPVIQGSEIVVDGITGSCTIYLTDAAGKIIVEKRYSSEKPEKLILPSISTGIHFIHIEQEGKQKIVRKVLVE
jgi:hypothetical protein